MDHHVEHEDNALSMGKMAGQAMAGEPVILDGIVSIGDVVKAVISEQKSVINELKGFVDEALRDRGD